MLILMCLLFHSCPVATAQAPQQPSTSNVGNRAHQRVIASRLADWAEIIVSRDSRNRQSESPSVAENALTLADSGKPTDLATLSFSPAATTTNSRTPKSTDVSTAFSLAAVAAAITQQSPLSTKFYNSALAQNLRQISFTATDSFPGQSSAPISKGSETYGLKFRFYPPPSGKRDYFYTYFEEREDELAKTNFVDSLALNATSSPFQQDLAKIRAYLVSQLQTTPNAVGFDSGGGQLSKQDAEGMVSTMDLLDAAVGRGLAAKDRSLDSMLRQTAEQLLNNLGTEELGKIQSAPEFAFESSARVSKGTNPNLFRNQVDYSQTFAKYFANVVNLGFDFQQAQTSSSRNRNIARFVEQIQFPFNIYHRDITTGRIKLTLGSEGDWGSNGPPTYKALGKLTLNLFPGFDVPMAVNYVNRTSGVNRGDIRAQFGIAVDFTKLWIRPSKSQEAIVPQ